MQVVIQRMVGEAEPNSKDEVRWSSKWPDIVEPQLLQADCWSVYIVKTLPIQAILQPFDEQLKWLCLVLRGGQHTELGQL